MGDIGCHNGAVWVGLYRVWDYMLATRACFVSVSWSDERVYPSRVQPCSAGIRSRFAGKRSRLCRECAVYACVALSLCLAYAFWFCWLSEERVDRIPWYFGMHNAGFLWWFVPASYQACGNVATASVLHIIHSVQDRLMHLQLLLTKVSQRMSKSRQQEAQSLRKSLSRLMQKNYWNEIDVFSDLCLPKWFRLEVNIAFFVSFVLLWLFMFSSFSAQSGLTMG